MSKEFSMTNPEGLSLAEIREEAYNEGMEDALQNLKQKCLNTDMCCKCEWFSTRRECNFVHPPKDWELPDDDCTDEWNRYYYDTRL